MRRRSIKQDADTSPIAGTYHGRDQYVTGVLQPLGQRLQAIPTLRVVRMLVDGDWACLQLQGRGTGKRGENYDGRASSSHSHAYARSLLEHPCSTTSSMSRTA